MELKPCPFCGYKWPFVEKVGSSETAKTVGIYSLYAVQCGACTASITSKTKENAVLAWNRWSELFLEKANDYSACEEWKVESDA